MRLASRGKRATMPFAPIEELTASYPYIYALSTLLQIPFHQLFTKSNSQAAVRPVGKSVTQSRRHAATQSIRNHHFCGNYVIITYINPSASLKKKTRNEMHFLRFILYTHPISTV